MKHRFNTMINNFLSFLLILLLCSGTIYANSKCDNLFDGFGVYRHGGHGFRFLRAGGVNVTGVQQYDTDFTLYNMGLENGSVQQWAKGKKKILLLGEGYGALLPFLLEQGISNTTALDIWYGEEFKNIPVEAQQRDDIVDFLSQHRFSWN